MANRANSFISGFSGGMGAMTNMINAREQRDYNAQKMEWMKEDRAFQEKERGKQESINNALGAYELTRGMTKEQRSEFDTGFMGLLNQDERIQQSLQRNVPEGGRKELGGWYPAKNGVGFKVNVFDKDGKPIRSGNLTEKGLSDGSDRDMVLPMPDLLEMMGGNPELISNTRLLAAKVRSMGGDVPVGETWNTINENGMRINRSNSGKEKLVGYNNKYGGKGGGKGGGKSSGSGGSGGTWKKVNFIKDMTDSTNPERVFSRLIERNSDTGEYRYADDDGTGNIKHQYFTATTPGSVDSVLGGGGDVTPEASKETPGSRKAVPLLQQTLDGSAKRTASMIDKAILSKEEKNKNREEEIRLREEEVRLKELLGMNVDQKKPKSWLSELSTH